MRLSAQRDCPDDNSARAGGIWRSADYRWLFAARSVSLLGSFVAAVVIPFAVLSAHGSSSLLGAVLGAGAVAEAAFLLAGGVWADRWPRKNLALIADVGAALAQGAGAAALLSGVHPLLGLACGSIVSSGCQGAALPAIRGLTPVTVAPGDLVRATGALSVSRSVCSIAGPAAGGLLLITIGPGAALAADAASFLISGAAIGRLIAGAAGGASPSGHPGWLWREDLRDGWRAFAGRSWIWQYTLFAAAFLFVVEAPLNVLGPLISRQDYGGPAAWAITLTVFGAGAVAGSLISGRLRPQRPVLVLVLLFACELPLRAAFALGAPVAALGVGGAVAGASLALILPLWQATLAGNVPVTELGRISSYDEFSRAVLYPLALAITGPAATLIGAHWVLGIGTIWLGISIIAAVCLPSIRITRQQLEATRQTAT